VAVTETKTYGRGIGGVVGRIGVLILVGAAFFIGLLGAIYLSLRSPEVTVPEIVGKDQTTGRTMLEDVGLDLRVRTSRFAPNASPNTIIDQTPRPGEVIKAGQTVAVVLARGEAREGEAAVITAQPQPSPTAANSDERDEENANTANANRDARGNRDANRNANRATNDRRERNANNNRSANINRNSIRNTNNAASNNANAANANTTRNVNTTRNTNNANRQAPTNANRAAPPPAANRNQNRSRPLANANRQ
jgi:beta-lactam-binding protein with PASTA domain